MCVCARARVRVSVYVCVYIYTCIKIMHIYTHIQIIHMYIHACMHACIYTYMHACIHSFIHLCVCVCGYVDTHMGGFQGYTSGFRHQGSEFREPVFRLVAESRHKDDFRRACHEYDRHTFWRVCLCVHAGRHATHRARVQLPESSSGRKRASLAAALEPGRVVLQARLDNTHTGAGYLSSS